ncbi:hypothetical protein RvY_14709 [Ramazzottius varieornatus]|uniref:Uncharacterized protein n=1 Tax=Ramazzottius varieornatus TaxID=947166 RepID=A0A1D1VZH3_RAMVA|nr:hypothetical protein RvY_14709 [Ramazzottius varieornatus]
MELRRVEDYYAEEAIADLLDERGSDPNPDDCQTFSAEEEATLSTCPEDDAEVRENKLLSRLPAFNPDGFEGLYSVVLILTQCDKPHGLPSHHFLLASTQVYCNE